MSADKCPVCGDVGNDECFYYDGPRCWKAELLAIERAAEVERLTKELKDANELIRLMAMRRDDAPSEVERLTAKLAKWESELSKVMPPDFKDWWQNSRDEWPEIARFVIQSGRACYVSAWEHVEKLTARVEELERKLKKPA